MALLGIDIGTTGCKVVAYSPAGQPLGRAYREYPSIVSGDWIELDPELVYSHAVACIREIAGCVDLAQITALSVSSMTDTVTPIGKDGRALMCSFIPFDARGIEEARELESLYGLDALFARTGMALHSSHTICKILWIKRHRPDVLEKTWKFLCYEDYILWKLGAEPVSSYSTASKTMYFDIRSQKWCEDLLRVCGITPEQLPGPVPSGVPVGRISAEAAEKTGLPQDTVLVSGGFDQACCALSCGVIRHGDVLDTTGTNEIIFFALDDRQDRALLEYGMNFSPHVVQDMFSAYAVLFNAGGAFKWCRDALYGDGLPSPQGDAYAGITSTFRDDPGDIVFLPFLTGVGTPELDPQASGAFLGLTLGADRSRMAQAILEGVTCEMRYNLEIVRELTGTAIDTLTVVGGATKSDYWLQLKCDIAGVCILVPEGLEPGACGAAMLAGIGSGVYQNAREAAAVFCGARKNRVIEPRANKTGAYQDAYRRYCDMRACVVGNPAFYRR